MATNIDPIAAKVPGDASLQADQVQPRPVQKEKEAGDKQTLPFPEQKEERELSQEDAEKIVEFLNSSTTVFDLSIRFKVADDIDRIVISVHDKETDEVVRQIPSEEIVDLASRLNEMVGILFNETA